MTPTEIHVLRLRYPQPLVLQSVTHFPYGEVPGWLRGVPLAPGAVDVSDLHHHTTANSRLEAVERTLLVTWLLMGQSLARTVPVHAPKTAVRYIRRLDPNLLNAVRYVQLRHHTLTPGQRGSVDGPTRTYQYRWIVQGHWRNQFYPSRNDHRPVWIDHHIKGPDGAPILDPDKLVNVLRR